MVEQPLRPGQAARDFESLGRQSIVPLDPIGFLKGRPEMSTRDAADVLLADIALRSLRGLPVPLASYETELAPVFADAELAREIRDAAGLADVRDAAAAVPVADGSAIARQLDDTVLCNFVLPEFDGADLSDSPSTSLDTDWSLTPETAGRVRSLDGRRMQGGLLSTTVIDNLTECEAFAHLSLPVLELLRGRMTPRSFRDGELIIEQGQPGTHLIVVRSGTVDVWTWHERGERHFLDEVGPGQILGEMALLTEEPRSANAVARGDVTCLMLPAGEFHALAFEHPEISVVLTQLLAARLGGSEHDVLSGKTLGSYHIQRRLGRGGMSVVYEARHADTGTRAAVKMMSHRLVYDAAARARFQDEADIIQSFGHENIVQMQGRFAAFHTFFLAMEFCNGVTLHELIAVHGHLPPRDVRAVLGQLARALLYAHGRGIVHRDIKPANLMLTVDGTVKLADFGLARPVTDLREKEETALVGTPRYMAPELFRGKPASPQTDAFAVGCIAFEMSTGRPLFRAESIHQLFQEHRRKTTAKFLVERYAMEADIAELTASLLSFDPASRFDRWEELADWGISVDEALIKNAIG